MTVLQQLDERNTHHLAVSFVTKEIGTFFAILCRDNNSQVVIVSNGSEQVVSQNTQIRVSTSIGEHTEVYSQIHVAWYRHDSSHWLSDGYHNMTGYVREQKLMSIERKVMHIHRMYGSIFWYFIALIVPKPSTLTPPRQPGRLGRVATGVETAFGSSTASRI